MNAEAPTMGGWATRLGDVFARRFPDRDPSHRRLGREGEHPVVRPDGTAADIAVLWPHLQALPGATTLYEGDLVVGVETPEVLFSAEVGRGTLEIIVGPVDDLHGLRARYEHGMASVLAAAEAEGLVVLGYGIQPGTAPSLELMTGKVRYGVLHEVIGEPWLWFASTASDQVHVDVTRDEAVPVTDLMNLLSPLVIALCANSSVAGGEVRGCSTRELAMGVIGAEGHRHGMTEGPARDLAGWVGRSLDLPFLMRREGERLVAGDGTFRDWLDAAPHTDDDAFEAWLLHEHYIWNSARPRAAHGTVELRAACQQPWSEHDAAAALGVGLVAAHASIAAFVHEQLGAEAWSALAGWHHAVVREGLAAPEPLDGLVAGVLERARDGLVARGAGEAPRLDPILARWEARRNPAQVAAQCFADGGLAALVEHARVR